MLRILILSLLVLVSFSFSIEAKVEKWVDENGKTHYGSRAPSGSNVKNVKIPAYNSSQTVANGKQERVVLYSTSWCPYCKKAKAYLKQKGIVFSEYDIEKNAAAKSDYDSVGGRGVPFLVKGTKTQGGFTPASYDAFFQ